MICKSCEGSIDECHKAIMCDKCDEWFHQKCSALSNNEYKILQQGNASIKWFCNNCQTTDTVSEEPLEVNAKLDKIMELLANLTERVAKIENLAGDVKRHGELLSSQEERIARLESNMLKSDGTTSFDDMNTAIRELKDRDARKQNIIIHNLPESTASNSAEREKDDEVAVKNLVEEGLETEVISTKCVRLGRKSEGKCRLLKVVISNVEMKKQILRNASRLKNNEAYANVFITNDLTYQERQQQRKLRSELNQRKEAGEQDLVIKHGRIVKRQSDEYARKQKH